LIKPLQDAFAVAGDHLRRRLVNLLLPSPTGPSPRAMDRFGLRRSIPSIALLLLALGTGLPSS